MKFYRIGEFAKMLGVSIKTLQNWDNTGKLKALRTPTNYRVYSDEQYAKYLESLRKGG